MRTLATPSYTSSQVAAVLHSGVNSVTSNYQILNRHFDVIGEVNPQGGTPSDERGVFYSKVEWQVDRTVIGALSLRNMPDYTNLGIDKKFQRFIKPFVSVRMPNGGFASYALGVYLWHGEPKRKFVGINHETWELTLGDQLQMLDMTGPTTGGFIVGKGQPLTDAIVAILQQTPVRQDYTGIISSPATASQALTWTSNLDNKSTPLTWLAILQALHVWIGYDPPWFDADGRYIARPARNLRTAPQDVIYQTSVNPLADDTRMGGLLLNGPEVDTNITAFANRVISRIQSGDSYRSHIADANDLWPNHPLRQGLLGFYVDKIVDIQAGTLAQDLQAVAESELQDALSTQQVVTLDSLAWPVHEAFDVVAFRFKNTTDFESPVVFQERGWSLELTNNGYMTHTLRRLYQ